MMRPQYPNEGVFATHRRPDGTPNDYKRRACPICEGLVDLDHSAALAVEATLVLGGDPDSTLPLEFTKPRPLDLDFVGFDLVEPAPGVH